MTYTQACKCHTRCSKHNGKQKLGPHLVCAALQSTLPSDLGGLYCFSLNCLRCSGHLRHPIPIQQIVTEQLSTRNGSSHWALGLICSIIFLLRRAYISDQVASSVAFLNTSLMTWMSVLPRPSLLSLQTSSSSGIPHGIERTWNLPIVLGAKP